MLLLLLLLLLLMMTTMMIVKWQFDTAEAVQETLAGEAARCIGQAFIVITASECANLV